MSQREVTSRDILEIKQKLKNMSNNTQTANIRSFTFNDLLDMQSKLADDYDPEFYFKFIDDTPLIPVNTEWHKMYLLPTIGHNNEEGEIRVDFSVGENLQQRINQKKSDKYYAYSGAFILVTNSENSDIFLLEDSDNGLEELEKLGLINETISDYIAQTIRSRKPLRVKIFAKLSEREQKEIAKEMVPEVAKARNMPEQIKNEIGSYLIRDTDANINKMLSNGDSKTGVGGRHKRSRKNKRKSKRRRNKRKSRKH